MSVKEHLRSQIEDTGGSPRLTKNEIELVRFVREGRFDWDGYLALGIEADEARGEQPDEQLYEQPHPDSVSPPVKPRNH